MNNSKTEIYNVLWQGQKAKFVVSNPEDLVQACFVKGHFFSIEELEDMLFYVAPNAVILDIGANVGNHTVFFAKYFQAKNVIPFEVNPAAIEFLRMNVGLNELANVDLSYLGSWSSTREFISSKINCQQPCRDFIFDYYFSRSAITTIQA